MRPDEQQALSKGQVARDGSFQLTYCYHIYRAYSRAQDGRDSFAVQVIGGEPVQVQFPSIIVVAVEQCLNIRGYGENSICDDAGDQAHEDGEENPQRNHRHGRGG